MTPEMRTRRKKIIDLLRNDVEARNRVMEALGLSEADISLLEKMLAESYLANTDYYTPANEQEESVLQKLKELGLVVESEIKSQA